MAQQFTWKGAAVIFDNEQFQLGFARGRGLYFHGIPHRQDASGTVTLKASELLRIVAIPDTHGHFHLDNETDIEDDLELIVGTLTGYISALSCSETPKEQEEWEKFPDANTYIREKDQQIFA